MFLGKNIVVGKDTRLSGDMLESALAAGIMSAGGTELSVGIIPTPAVALLVRELHADGGAVISASHNPPEYNGIKLFDAEGYKLPDEVEDKIEEFIKQGGLEGAAARAEEGAEGEDAAAMLPGDEVGVALPVDEACEIYIEHAVQSVRAQGIDFSGMRIALDTGHGASSLTSAEAFRRLGAEVIAINEDFDGTDINVNCGSTHLEPLAQLMRESGADVGVAHDGDADRVMLMTPDGTEIDGDMVEEMRAKGYAIGGEQSGHMILLEHNSTGDGLMTACQFLAAVKRADVPVADVVSIMKKFPQTLINVRVRDKHAVEGNEAIAAAVAKAEEALGDSGRVLLRPSGTEPVVRVMVEAEDADVAKAHAEAIAAVVEAEI